MDTLADLRVEEFKKYERPKYYGTMRPWRVVLIAEWLAPLRKAKRRTIVDVGCGCPPSSRGLAEAFGFEEWRGCEVVESAGGDRIDIIPGAHALPYGDKSYDLAMATDVFEHILEADVAPSLRELDRVTKHEILLGISQVPGPFHPTIRSTDWWLEAIRENMPKRTPTVIYADRIPKVKQPYLWVDVR